MSREPLPVALVLLLALAALPLAPAAPAPDAPVDEGALGEPVALPVTLRLTASAGEGARTVVLDARWRIAGAVGPGSLALELPPGLALVDGEPTRAVAPGTGAAEFVARATGSGAFSVTVRFDGHFGGRAYTEAAEAVFRFDENGTLVPGWPHDPVGVDTVIETVPARAARDVDALDSACTVDFSLRYLTPDRPSVPAHLRLKPIPHLYVEVLDFNMNVRASGYTDEHGDVHFEFRTDPCHVWFHFKRAHQFASDGNVRVLGVDAGGTTYRGTTTDYYNVMEYSAFRLIIHEPHAGSAWMHGQAVDAFLYTSKLGEHVVSRPVHVYWQKGHAFDCPACYRYGNPARIDVSDGTFRAFDGHTIYHEYGHHVHADVTSNTMPRPAYGNHGCGQNCHEWDSGHATTGSAFLEGWANFFVGVVQNSARTGPYDLSDPDAGRTDHPDVPCRGPFRECAVAAALWQSYTPEVWLHHHIDALRRSPQDIHEFARIWYRTGLESRSALAVGMTSYGIATSGDAASWKEAGDGFYEATPVDNGGSGDLTHEPHWPSLDGNDYYRFHADKGERIAGRLQPSAGADFDLVLMDPSGKVRDGSGIRADGRPEEVEVTADVAGEWRLAVLGVADAQGLYSFQVQVGDSRAGQLPSSASCGSLTGYAARELRALPYTGGASADVVGHAC